MLAGAGLAGHGAYMKAKAALSQVLLEHAFEERLKGDAAAPYQKVQEVLVAVKALDIAELGLVTTRAQ